MTKRKKRLEKGIESLKKQIEIHEEKVEDDLREGHLERAEYHKREIEDLLREIEYKESKRDRKK